MRKDNKATLLFYGFRRAWTGGTTPDVEDKADLTYRALRSLFFRESLQDCGGLDLWKCAGTSCMERARIFWNRATLDAHATLRTREK